MSENLTRMAGADRTTTDFATGMQRSGALKDLAFTAIHPIALISLARTLGGEGSVKYGAKNWEMGASVEDDLNHVFYHYAMYMAGDRSEPHLDHLLCGAHFAVVHDTLHPELSKPHLRGPGCTLTPEILAHLESGKAERQRRREAGEFDRLGDWKLSEVPEVRTILEQRAAAEAQASGEIPEDPSAKARTYEGTLGGGCYPPLWPSVSQSVRHPQ